MKKQDNKPFYRSLQQSGNMFFALFGAVGLVGVIGASAMQVMKGPVRSMHNVTQKTIAENNMIAAGKLALITAASQANSGDCDLDGTVEPIPFEAAGVGPKPTGGGYLPNTIGAAKQDPWGITYGYCVWDHGPVLRNGTCTDDAGRLTGQADENGVVIAVISAGPDRSFQTSCANAPGYIQRVSGSDDIILSYSYDEATSMAGGLWGIKAGAPETAEIEKNIEVKNSSGDVVFGVDSTTAPLKPSMKVDFISGLSNPSIEFLNGITFPNPNTNIALGSNWLSGDGGNEGLRVDAEGDVGVGGVPTASMRLDVTGGTVRIGHGATYDVWIQGGTATSGAARNLALLGQHTNDTLYLNHGSEYANGVVIGGPATMAGGSFNLANQALIGSAGTVLDANGGWVRTYGNTGWFNGTHNGGLTMTDATYIRNQSGESLYIAGSAGAPAILGDHSGAQYGVQGISGTSYGVVGQTESAGAGGVRGYTANSLYWGILGHANAYSFYGNGALYNAGNANITGTTTLNNLTVNGTFSGAGDNLGNHSATTNLDMNGHAIVADVGTIRDAGGGWIRTYGNTGWYSQTHGGGWYMQDTTYIRNYNSKQVYLNAALFSPIMYDTDNTAYYIDPHNISRLNDIRPNIIYDGQNTGYYWDGNGTTSMNAVYANAYYYHSDERLKQNIATLGADRIADLYKIRGVSFDWKETGKTDIGFVAQELQQVFPELVDSNKEGIMGVKYGNVVALLVEAAKSQKAEIDSLKTQVATIKDNLVTAPSAAPVAAVPVADAPVSADAMPKVNVAALPYADDITICTKPVAPACGTGEITDSVARIDCNTELTSYIYSAKIYGLCVRGDKAEHDAFASEYATTLKNAEKILFDVGDTGLDSVMASHVIALKNILGGNAVTPTTPVEPDVPEAVAPPETGVADAGAPVEATAVTAPATPVAPITPPVSSAERLGINNAVVEETPAAPVETVTEEAVVSETPDVVAVPEATIQMPVEKHDHTMIYLLIALNFLFSLALLGMLLKKR